MEKLDIPALMEKIRENVRTGSGRSGTSTRPMPFPSTDLKDSSTVRAAGALYHSEERRFLNLQYKIQPGVTDSSYTTHRKGPIGRFILKLKRKLLSTIIEGLKDHFERENEYRLHVARFCNEVSTYVDDRDGANFWELVRKIDVDIAKALERIARVEDDIRADREALKNEVNELYHATLGELRSSAAVQGEQLKTLDAVVRGLEAILARYGKKEPSSSSEPRLPSSLPDQSYLLLENRFRGSEKDIHERLTQYAEYLSSIDNSNLPLLDIGGGRGELLRLLKDREVQAYGIDMDEGMVDAAQVHGVDMRKAEALSHLASLPNHSLRGVIAVQVVEHLPMKVIEELCRRCREKVAPGGAVIFETINPRSLLALSSNYYRDPTHVWPLHPDTLSYLMELQGLKVQEVRYLSPVSKEGSLRELPLHEQLSPRWTETFELLNHNIRQLNELVYGYQDYCVIARV